VGYMSRKTTLIFP